MSINPLAQWHIVNATLLEEGIPLERAEALLSRFNDGDQPCVDIVQRLTFGTVEFEWGFGREECEEEQPVEILIALGFYLKPLEEAAEEENDDDDVEPEEEEANDQDGPVAYLNLCWNAAHPGHWTSDFFQTDGEVVSQLVTPFMNVAQGTLSTLKYHALQNVNANLDPVWADAFLRVIARYVASLC